MAKGRGRLSSLKLLPRDCSPVVQWAASELQANDRSQLDIYKEFVAKLEALQRERRGELEFVIPSFNSFNRYSIALDAMARDIIEAREMASAIAGTFDASESDDLTQTITEAIKGLVLTILRTKKDGLDSKAAQALASAVHKTAQAQSISSARRQKVEADFKEKAEAAISAVAKAKGMTKETVEDIKARILGIRHD